MSEPIRTSEELLDVIVRSMRAMDDDQEWLVAIRDLRTRLAALEAVVKSAEEYVEKHSSTKCHGSGKRLIAALAALEDVAKAAKRVHAPVVPHTTKCNGQFDCNCRIEAIDELMAALAALKLTETKPQD